MFWATVLLGPLIYYLRLFQKFITPSRKKNRSIIDSEAYHECIDTLLFSDRIFQHIPSIVHQ